MTDMGFMNQRTPQGVLPHAGKLFSCMGFVCLLLMLGMEPLKALTVPEETVESVAEGPEEMVSATKTEGRYEGLSICFVLPYLDNGPASFFGHVFLRFLPRKPDLDSPTVAYMGNSEEEVGTVPLLMEGLAGKLTGRYEWVGFSSQLEAYAVRQQRTIVEYTLDFDEKEIASMERYIRIYGNHERNYNFLFNNCTTGLVALLDVARPDLKLAERLSSIVMPKDLIAALLDAGVVIEQRIYPPLSDTLYGVYASLDERQRQLFKQQEGEPADEGLSEDRDCGKLRFLLDGYALLQGKELGKTARNAVFSNPLSRFPLATASMDDVVSSGFQRTYGSFDLSVLSTGEGWETGIAVHPLLIEREDRQLFSSSATSLEIGGVEARFGNHRPRLEKVTILSLTSLNVSTPVHSAPSWSFDIGLLRDDPEKPLRFSASLGFGYTVGSRHCISYLLPHLVFLSAPMDWGLSVDFGTTIRQGAVDFGVQVSYPLLFRQAEARKDVSLFLRIRMTRMLSFGCSFDPFHDKASVAFRHSFG